MYTACPPSPARSGVDPKTGDYILTWLTDLSDLYPDLLDDLPGYAKALCKVGYKSFASLNFMHAEFQGDPVTEVKTALKINVVLAKAIVAEALALHPRDIVTQARSPRAGPPRSSSPRSRNASPHTHERSTKERPKIAKEIDLINSIIL